MWPALDHVATPSAITKMQNLTIYSGENEGSEGKRSNYQEIEGVEMNIKFGLQK